MRKQYRIFTTAVLVIFVLCHVLPLHNAISKCVEKEDDTVEKLERLVQIRQDAVTSAKDTLQRAKDKELIDSIAIHSYIQAGLGAAGGSLGGPKGIMLGVTIGGISGAITGTIVYYRAINNAKGALKAAETRLAHAKAALHLAKQAEAESTIQPQNYAMNVNWLPTHNIDISSDTLPIKEVSIAFMPLEATETRPPIYTGEGFSSNIWKTTVSYTFSRYQKGIYMAQVTVTLIDGHTIYRQYHISVTDE